LAGALVVLFLIGVGIVIGVWMHRSRYWERSSLAQKIQFVLADAERPEARPHDRLLVPEVNVTSADEAFLNRVTDVIEANLSRASFTVDDLAADVGVSPRHLQRKLKRLTGHSAAEFVRRYRVEWGAELLAEDAGSVSRIAYRVGFGTRKTFTKHFKAHFDCSPSAYAERHDA
jgi:AraC-like DNA-binding protein